MSAAVTVRASRSMATARPSKTVAFFLLTSAPSVVMLLLLGAGLLRRNQFELHMGRAQFARGQPQRLHEAGPAQGIGFAGIDQQDAQGPLTAEAA